MVCFKRGRRKKIEWKWEGQRIEEVKEIKYFGYVMRSNGGKEGQI